MEKKGEVPSPEKDRSRKENQPETSKLRAENKRLQEEEQIKESGLWFSLVF